MNRAMRIDAATSLLAFACLVGCTASTAKVSGTNPTDPAPSTEDGGTNTPTVEETDAVAAKVALWLSGDFDSTAQAKRDPEYREITLSACEASASELGAHALYVEQAVLGSPTPYRQRVYIVEPIDATSARSLVFELTKPAAAVGLCKKGSKPAFTKADVIAREGCSVEMHWVTDHFVGHTPNARWNGERFEPDPLGAKCSSTLQGASYAQSSVELHEGKLTSWDQGFDAKEKQVWGAIKGPYEFRRKGAE